MKIVVPDDWTDHCPESAIPVVRQVLDCFERGGGVCEYEWSYLLMEMNFWAENKENR